MARCPAHGNRIQLNPSRAVNLFGATPQPDCRRTLDDDDWMVEVVLIETGERAEYRLSRIYGDPEAQ